MVSRNYLMAGTFAAALLLGACSDGGANQATPQAMMPTVETMGAELTTVPNTTELSGRARAFAAAEIRPQVTGIIQARLFTEGDTVEKGQALYQIDPAEYASAVESARASLAGAEAAAATARETAKRYEQLALINAVSQQEYDRAAATAKQAEADIALQRAAVNRALIDLSRTKIKSPISGRIGRSDVTAGALVTQNQTAPLASVVQLDPINIDLTASSARIVTLRQQTSSGMIATTDGAIPVTIKFENGTVYDHPGQLEFSEVSVDETAGTVAVRVVVPNPEGLLLPGMFLRASFAAGKYENVVTVPQSLVSRTPKGEPVVLIVNAEGVVEQRAIQIDGQADNNWIVHDGLVAGDQIAVSNLQSIRPGMTVNAVPDTASADSAPAKPGVRGGIQ